MDSMEWIRQQEGDLLADIEDWFRTEGKAFMPKLIKMKVRIVPAISMEDELVHTDGHPFCEDLDCPCHEDEELKKEYLVEPWLAGHLAQREADRLYRGQQIR